MTHRMSDSERQEIADRNRNRTILWVLLSLVVLAVVYFAASASWVVENRKPPATTTQPK